MNGLTAISLVAMILVPVPAQAQDDDDDDQQPYQWRQQPYQQPSSDGDRGYVYRFQPPDPQETSRRVLEQSQNPYQPYTPPPRSSAYCRRVHEGMVVCQ
jgi:hypothetical protein